MSDDKPRQHAAYMRDWRARNPGYQSRYREASAEKQRLRRDKGGRARDKELRQAQRLSNPVLYLLRKARARAKDKGFEFDLTEEWARARFTGHCEATGLPFTLEIGTAAKNNPWAPTLDRRDPDKGYTQENCWIVCWAYNCAKQAWTEETVMTMAKALVEGEVT